MTEPAPKKRRVGGNPHAQKPFKSPFRRAPGAAAAAASSPPRPTDPGLADPVVQHSISSPTAPRTSPSVFASRSHTCSQVAQLQRQHTALILHSRQTRADLDTVKQAFKIETASKDAELSRLIELWRVASQSAAEEIFVTVKNRVNRMGGVVAWKKKERDRKERQLEWSRQDETEQDASDGSDENEDEDEDDDEDGVPIDAERRTQRAEMRELVKEAKADAREARKAAKAEMAEQRELVQAKSSMVEEEREDEAFTMDMMLKELKVDLRSIGFDADAQRWV